MSLAENYPTLQIYSQSVALSSMPASPYYYARFFTHYLATLRDQVIQTSDGIMQLVSPIGGLKGDTKLEHDDLLLVVVRKLQAQKWEGTAQRVTLQHKNAYEELWKETNKVSKSKKKDKIHQIKHAQCSYEFNDQMADYL